MIEKDRFFTTGHQGGGLITRRPIIQLWEMFSSGQRMSYPVAQCGGVTLPINSRLTAFHY
jgi:hypothetical protein